MLSRLNEVPAISSPLLVESDPGKLLERVISFCLVAVKIVLNGEMFSCCTVVVKLERKIDAIVVAPT